MEKIKLDFCRTLTDRGNVYFECVDDNNLTGDYYRASDVDALLADVAKLVDEIAQEAHTMGRIYEKTLSPINPAIEFNRVSDMVKLKLKAIAAVERHWEEENP